jgi:hypothetical protein
MRAARGMLPLLLALALAAGAAAQPAAPPARVGGLVFLATASRTVLPMTVAELRARAEERLDAILAESGTTNVGARAMASLAGTWRVRSGQALPAGFLADLRGAQSVSELCIVTVVVAQDRLVVLARRLDTADGRLGGVWLDEQFLTPPMVGTDRDAEAAALRRALDAGLGALTRPSAPAPEEPATWLVLPAVAMGCPPEEGLAATFALLWHLRTRENLTVIDPAVVLGELYAAGLDPASLDAAGREFLRSRFGVDAVVRPALIAYDEAGQSRGSARADGDDAVMDAPLRSYSFTLTTIDLRTGTVSGVADVHQRAQSALGLFGCRREVRRLEILRDAVGAAWTDLRLDRGDT